VHVAKFKLYACAHVAKFKLCACAHIAKFKLCACAHVAKFKLYACVQKNPFLPKKTKVFPVGQKIGTIFCPKGDLAVKS
jgi:hypothetical protein